MGVRSSVKNRLIVVAIGTAIRLVRDPINAAPKPAICPTGNIASAFKLPNNIPIKKKPKNIVLINNHRGGIPSKYNVIAVNAMPKTKEKNSARSQIECIPHFITIRPLNKDARPIENASVANTNGNHSPVS